MRNVLIDAEQAMIRGKELLQEEINWIQGSYSLDQFDGFASTGSKRACKFCFNGALVRACNEVSCSRIEFDDKGLIKMRGDESVRAFEAHREIIKIIAELTDYDDEESKAIDSDIGKVVAKERWIELWNDAEDRTHGEVIELLDNGIARAAALIEAA